MTLADFLSLLPLIIVGYGAVAVLVIGAFWRNRSAVALLSAATLAAGLAAIFVTSPLTPRLVTPLIRIDSFSLFYMALFFLGGLAICAFSSDYLRQTEVGTEKFFSLLLFAVLGSGVLAASKHFASFFLGLESLSVALYGLIGYGLRRPASQEAAMKYLILAGASLAFLLLGMALIYFEFGTMEFGALAIYLRNTGLSPIALLGLGLMLVGFGFKLALAPFHAWAPDVYQGAPAPISALVATVSKAAMFALLLRFLSLIGLQEQGSLALLIQILAVVTMLAGNLLALLQQNVKRLLAYSSLAHIGYLLIPLLADGSEGAASIGFYFVSYFITTLGAFGVVSALSSEEEELEDLDDYRGLGFRRPWLGAALALTMLSLAGIPLTVGFIAKLYIFTAAAHAGLWILLIVGLLNSGLAAFYYLRVLVAVYARPATEQSQLPEARPLTSLALAVLSALLVAFGVYPGPLISLCRLVFG